MAALVWKQLQAVAQAYGGLANLAVRVSRSGTRRNTRYTIVPLSAAPTVQPTNDLSGQIATVRQYCKLASLDPKKELQEFLDQHPEVQGESPDVQLAAFLPVLKEKVSDWLDDDGLEDAQPKQSRVRPCLRPDLCQMRSVGV